MERQEYMFVERQELVNGIRCRYGEIWANNGETQRAITGGFNVEELRDWVILDARMHRVGHVEINETLGVFTSTARQLMRERTRLRLKSFSMA